MRSKKKMALDKEGESKREWNKKQKKQQHRAQEKKLNKKLLLGFYI
jgi:hypothetical protein